MTELPTTRARLPSLRGPPPVAGDDPADPPIPDHRSTTPLATWAVIHSQKDT